MSYLESRFGALDPKTGEVELFKGIPPDSEPHMVRFSNDGKAYITLQKAGKLARFDPETKQMEVSSFGLPKGNFIHNIVKLPNGDFWAVLQEGDALARFNLRKGRFDKFVKVPIKDSGPRDITYVRSTNTVYATLFAANKIAELDPDTGKLTLHDTYLDAVPYSQAVTRKPLAKLTLVRPDAQEHALWIATLSGGELLRYDLKSRKIERVGCGITVPSGPLGLTNDTKGRLWYTVLFPSPGKMVRVEQ